MISSKTHAQIKKEYRAVLVRERVAGIIFSLIGLLYFIILMFISFPLEIYGAINTIFIISLVVYTIFIFFNRKCPSCQGYTGMGNKRSNCKKCKVSLQ